MGFYENYRKFKRYVAIGTVVLLPFFYPDIIITVANLVIDWQPRMSIAQAQKAVEEEKKKLGIDAKVQLQVAENDELARFKFAGFSGINEYGYVIGANKSDLKRLVVRHELYHLTKERYSVHLGRTIEESLARIEESQKKSYYGGFFKPKSYWERLYIKEPQAHIYALTGVQF